MVQGLGCCGLEQHNPRPTPLRLLVQDTLRRPTLCSHPAQPAFLALQDWHPRASIRQRGQTVTTSKPAVRQVSCSTQCMLLDIKGLHNSMKSVCTCRQCCPLVGEASASHLESTPVSFMGRLGDQRFSLLEQLEYHDLKVLHGRVSAVLGFAGWIRLRAVGEGRENQARLSRQLWLSERRGPGATGPVLRGQRARRPANMRKAEAQHPEKHGRSQS